MRCEMNECAVNYLPGPGLRRLPGKELRMRYDAAVEGFRKVYADGGKPPEALRRFYREEVFPLAMARIFRDTDVSTVFDCLYLTVGTQPYSPTLSALATPARRIAFIATETSLGYAREAAEMARVPEDRRECYVFREPFSAAEMIRCLWRQISLHLENGESVAMDITSGKKNMSAALSGLAAADPSIQQFYLDADYSLRPFAVNERRIDLPNTAVIIENLRAEDAAEEPGGEEEEGPERPGPERGDPS